MFQSLSRLVRMLDIENIWIVIMQLHITMINQSGTDGLRLPHINGQVQSDSSKKIGSTSISSLLNPQKHWHQPILLSSCSWHLEAVTLHVAAVQL